MIPYLLLAALVFGACYAVDKVFTRLFRNQQQHKSGMAVKPGKRAATLGLFLAVLGAAGVLSGISQGTAMLVMSVLMLLLGAGLVLYYLSYGIYYDAEGFLVSAFGKRNRVYHYKDIRQQQRFVVQGGSVLVELHMADGGTVAVQTTMDGAFPFLNYAFARWCEAKGLDPDGCQFHNPGDLCWFPEEEEV